jgi:GNAT superfamily N-acetyltransferase
MLDGLQVRYAEPEDWDRVQEVLPVWWGGRDLRALLPRLFFQHFCSTSYVVEDGDELVGFLVGFLCPSHHDEAYVHFVGVDPSHRGRGIARDLYERFFDLALTEGRTVARAITAPVNAGSVAFHRRMGFEPMPGDGEIDGLPVRLDHDGPGVHRIRFERRLAPGPPRAASPR